MARSQWRKWCALERRLLPLTGAVESTATDLPSIIQKCLANNSERQGRVIDFDEEGSMEQKKEGYF